MEEGKKVVKSPVDAEELREIRLGETFYLDGLLLAARDKVHERTVLQRRPLPLDARGLAVIHAGPIIVEREGSLVCLSLGSTTSVRFENLIPKFVELTGVRLVIGKGGVSRRVSESLSALGAIYAVYPGGLGALGATSVKKVLLSFWEDLGPAESAWLLEVKELGPLIAATDLKGGNLIEDVLDLARAILLSKRVRSKPEVSSR
ncbi:MAG: fumarate hydratase C-terminal domain-containing protein [Acidilobaceae archaeon]